MVSSLSSARRELEKLAGGTRDKKHPTRGAGATREVAGTKDRAGAPEPTPLGKGRHLAALRPLWLGRQRATQSREADLGEGPAQGKGGITEVLEENTECVFFLLQHL